MLERVTIRCPLACISYDAVHDSYIVTADRRLLEGGPSWSNNPPTVHVVALRQSDDAERPRSAIRGIVMLCDREALKGTESAIIPLAPQHTDVARLALCRARPAKLPVLEGTKNVTTLDRSPGTTEASVISLAAAINYAHRRKDTNFPAIFSAHGPRDISRTPMYRSDVAELARMFRYCIEPRDDDWKLMEGKPWSGQSASAITSCASFRRAWRRGPGRTQRMTSPSTPRLSPTL